VSKYNITDPAFGVWDETDVIVDITSGTISDGCSNSSTDFFCPHCYFMKMKKYNSLPYFEEDGALPKCEKHGVIDWTQPTIKLLIMDVERDISTKRK
jgi:protein associated with RNAse G/E